MKTAKRMLSLLVLGTLALLMGSLTAWAQGDEARFIRISGASLQEVTEYITESGKVLKTEPGEVIPLELEEVLAILPGNNYVLVSDAGQNWSFTAGGTPIRLPESGEITFELTDASGKTYLFTASHTAIADAYAAGGNMGLHFDHLLCEEKVQVPVKTGTVSISANFLMDGEEIEPSSLYELRFCSAEEDGLFQPKTLERNPLEIYQKWTLDEIPVGTYSLEQVNLSSDEGYIIVPAVTGADLVGNTYEFEVKEGETTQVTIENNYYNDSDIENFSIPSTPVVTPVQEKLIVTCPVEITAPDATVFLPGIRCYLQTPDGKYIEGTRDSFDGVSTVTFSFTLDYSSEGRECTCYAVIGQREVQTFITIPARPAQTAPVEIIHRYGKNTWVEEEITGQPGETLDTGWIKNGGTEKQPFSDGVKQASVWRLYEISQGTERTLLGQGDVKEAQFEGLTAFAFEAGKSYCLELDYQTAYQIAHYLQADSLSDGAVELDGKYYLLEESGLAYWLSWEALGDLSSKTKPYDGYQYSSIDSSQLTQNAISEDGSTVIEIYYDKKKSTPPETPPADNQPDTSVHPQTDPTPSKPEKAPENSDPPVSTESLTEEEAPSQPPSPDVQAAPDEAAALNEAADDEPVQDSSWPAPSSPIASPPKTGAGHSAGALWFGVLLPVLVIVLVREKR